MDKSCENCAYGVCDELGDITCCCGESDNAAEYMTADEHYDYWEEKGNG